MLVLAVSGIAWITVLSSLQVAAQMALPNWVRSRGLAVFMTVFMGSMAGGSLLWGVVARMAGINGSSDRFWKSSWVQIACENPQVSQMIQIVICEICAICG